jgi:hypothetical protein
MYFFLSNAGTVAHVNFYFVDTRKAFSVDKADGLSNVVLSWRINGFEPPILHAVHGVYRDTYNLSSLNKIELYNVAYGRTAGL